MGFFESIANKIDGYALQITISKNDKDKLNVMVYPKISDTESIQKEITPVSVSGTPEELDSGFFATLGASLDKTKVVAAQIKTFGAGLDKAAKAADPKKGKDTKKTVTKTNEPTLMDQKPAEKKEEPKAETAAPASTAEAPVTQPPDSATTQGNDQFGDEEW